MNLQNIKSVLRRVRALVEVHRNERLPPHQLQALAQKRFNTVIRQCWDHNRFYRNKWKAAGIGSLDDILQGGAEIPLTTKLELAEAWDNGAVCDGYDVGWGRIRGTSGSTGRPLRVYTPLDAFEHLLAAQYRSFSMVGALPWHDMVYVKSEPRMIHHGQTPAKTTSHFGLFRLTFVALLLPPEAFVRELEEASPRMLYSYPSKLLEVLRVVDWKRLQALGIAAIVTNSELSSRAERTRIGEAFGCEVYDEYGSEEAFTISNQCSEKNYHLHADTIRLEILDPQGRPCLPGQTGRVIVTSLVNLGMPIVRYEQGDLASLKEGACGCGRTTPLMADIQGRNIDRFYFRWGKVETSINIINCLDDIPETYRLQGFQVIQETMERVRFVYQSPPGFEAEAEACRIALIELFENTAEVIVERVDQLQRDPSGKFRAVRSLVDQDAAVNDDGRDARTTAEHRASS